MPIRRPAPASLSRLSISAAAELYPRWIYASQERSRGRGYRLLGLDNKILNRRGAITVNPNTHQKFSFRARQHMAAGRALYICPERPGAAS